MADKLMMFKYVVKNVACAAGKTLTFMPKPIFQDNGSGMHIHQSLWKGGEPLFFDETGYAGLSDMARWYIGGLLHHAPAILAFAEPDDELATSGWCPATRRRSTSCTRSATARRRAHPAVLEEPEGQAPRVPLPRPVVQPVPRVLGDAAWPASTACRTASSRRAPVDKDLYDLPPEELAKVPQVPGSLDEALDALEADHDFLNAGGVFTHDLIETWIEYKRENEIDAVRLRPHPYEFDLYYDI